MSSSRKRKRSSADLGNSAPKKPKVEKSDSGVIIHCSTDLMPLDLPDVVGEVFKWLDGFYLTPILVKKSWRELARKSIPIYLEAEFGIKIKAINAAWDMYKTLLRNNGLPEVAVLYRISQNKAALEMNSTENVSEKQEILDDILKNIDYAKPWYNSHLLMNWQKIYKELKGYELSRLNEESYKKFLDSANSLTKDSKAIERLVKRLKVHRVENMSYENSGDKYYKEGLMDLVAVDQQGKRIKLCWNYLLYLNLSRDDVRGIHDLFVEDTDSVLASFARWDDTLLASKKLIVVPSVQSDSEFNVMLFEKPTRALLSRLNEGMLDLVKFYTLIMMMANMDFVPQKNIIPYPIIGAMERDVGDYIHSVYVLSNKYDALKTIYKIADEKRKDPSLWSNFFNYKGDRKDEYFNQIKQLALQMNFLYLQTKDIKFNIDSCAPGFGHYVSARIVIGHEGELLTDKLVLNYTHEIYMNDEINGGLYGGEECEKESGVSCYVSISDADKIIFPPASKFPHYYIKGALNTNAIFIPESAQQLIPKEFGLISFDTFSDMLIVMLGLADLITSFESKKCNSRTTGYHVQTIILRGEDKPISVSFNAKTYAVDVDKLYETREVVTLTEDDALSV